MKLTLSTIFTLVVGFAHAGECPQGSTRTVLEDGSVRIVRESGVVTTIGPDRKITYTFEPRDQAHRDYVMANCNMTTPSPIRYTPRTVITTPSGTVTGYIVTK
jgi:hypothetical protein